MPEIGALRSLFQVCSCWQDRDAPEFIVSEVSKDHVHLLDLVGWTCTGQEGQVLAVVFSSLIQWIQVLHKVGIGTIKKRCILVLVILVKPGLLTTVVCIGLTSTALLAAFFHQS